MDYFGFIRNSLVYLIISFDLFTWIYFLSFIPLDGAIDTKLISAWDY